MAYGQQVVFKCSQNTFNANCLSIKTQSLTFSNIIFDPKIREKEIGIRKGAKYLGIQIDDKLNWKHQIWAVSAKASRAVGFLKYSKQLQLGRRSIQAL